MDAARTLLHSNTWPPSSDKSLYVIVRPREMSSMENSLRCIADGRAREKPFCGKPQFQARALSVAPLRTPLRSSTTVPRKTRVCDPVRMDGRAFVAPPRLRRGLLCASRQIALTPARRRVSLAPGISGHQIIPSSTVMRVETTNRSTGHLGANRGVRPKTRREPGAPQSRDPVRKPPTRTLTRDRAARPRLRVRVVTCVHHNILEPRGVRASSDLTGSPSPRPPPSLRVSSLTPKTRGLSASSQPCRTSSRWCPRACASWARRWCRWFESRFG